MPFDTTTLVAGGAILFASTVAQSAVGFGYALFAVAPLVWLGIPLPNVIAIIMTCSVLQGAMGAYGLRSYVPWRMVMGTAVIRLVAVAAGTFLLKRLVAADPGSVRLAVGVVLCAMIIVLFIWQPKPVARLHPAWIVPAFITSGLLGGFCGMGGPPVVIWLLAHDWDTRKTRGFLFSAWTISVPFQLVILVFAFGTTILQSVAVGIACLPLVYAGTRIGLPIGHHMSRRTLCTTSYAILLAIGITTIIKAL